MTPSSSLSAMIGTSCVGATFQLGGGGLPSISLASKAERRSPVALDITYLPHMSLFCLTRTMPGGVESLGCANAVKGCGPPAKLQPIRGQEKAGARAVDPSPRPERSFVRLPPGVVDAVGLYARLSDRFAFDADFFAPDGNRSGDVFGNDDAPKGVKLCFGFLFSWRAIKGMWA